MTTAHDWHSPAPGTTAYRVRSRVRAVFWSTALGVPALAVLFLADYAGSL